MTCDRCADHVREALEAAGAERVEVDWRAGRALLDADGAAEASLRAALDGTRYRLAGMREIDAGGTEANGDFDVDLLVVGSGGGAFAGAIRARDLGRSVLMVERGTVGGTCVNVGCIPSKSMPSSSACAKISTSICSTSTGSACAGATRNCSTRTR
jgi:mercuric reductase